MFRNSCFANANALCKGVNVTYTSQCLRRESRFIFRSPSAERYNFATQSKDGRDFISQDAPCPITVDEFKETLDQGLERPEGKRGPQYIGLAISGGMDSMCLAHLAQGLNAKHPDLYNFRAIVVDHKARPESTEEANNVKHSLEQTGLQTSLLEIRWPPDAKPLEQFNFEAQARTKRYRAVGLECRRLGIRHLLLAHHEDDQAETVLMRIVQGYTSRGLMGISPRVTIPECHGIPGVFESPQSNSSKRVFEIAEKGIWIHRPLLDFSKARLRATCEASGVRWEEDPTNANPTLTLRNAVRHLLHTKRLPEALEKKSLLSLSRGVERQVRRAEENGAMVFREMDIFNLDLRSGKVTVSFSDMSRLPVVDETERVEAIAIALKNITRAISPFDIVEHRQMVQVAKKLMSDSSVGAAQAVEGDAKSTLTTFHTAGVLWQRQDLHEALPPFWTLSRQPYDTKRPGTEGNLAKLCRVWYRSATTGDVLDTQNTESDNPGSPFGTWQLYDGRFWIRLWSSDHQSLAVRPFEISDMARIRTSLPRLQRLRIERLIRDAAPGGVRYTLPALAESLNGRMLALPSLDIRLFDRDEIPMDWEIQYKNISFSDWERKDSRKSWLMRPR